MFGFVSYAVCLGLFRMQYVRYWAGPGPRSVLHSICDLSDDDVFQLHVL